MIVSYALTGTGALGLLASVMIAFIALASESISSAERATQLSYACGGIVSSIVLFGLGTAIQKLCEIEQHLRERPKSDA